MQLGRRTRTALIVVATGAAVAALVPLVPLARLEFVNRIDYGTLDLSGPPPRIDWCDRRYYPTDSPVDITRAEAVQRSGVSPGWTASAFRVVGRSPSGLDFYARITDGRDRFAGPLLPCSMAVFLQIGPDRFRPYGLSGGP